jgi:hypothetical protein
MYVDLSIEHDTLNSGKKNESWKKIKDFRPAAAAALSSPTYFN